MIKTENLTKFKGEQALYEKLELTVEGKGVHCILCPDKDVIASLLDVICGCAFADDGSVTVSEHDMNGDSTAAKRRIGYIPEAPAFYSNMTALEILDFIGNAKGIAPDKKYRQIKEATELVGIADEKKVLVKHLSSEQKKKLSIAAALLGNPEAIVFSSPFAGISAASRKEMADLIAMLGSLKNVIVGSTELSDLEDICDDVVIISSGKCLLHATKSEILERLNRGSSLKARLVGEKAVISSLISGCPDTKSFQLDEKDDDVFSLRVEYSSEEDLTEYYRALLREGGVTVVEISTERFTLSDAYYALVGVNAPKKENVDTDDSAVIEESEKEEE